MKVGTNFLEVAEELRAISARYAGSHAVEFGFTEIQRTTGAGSSRYEEHLLRSNLYL